MNLTKIIFDKLKKECRGKERAIKREDLLEYCQLFYPELNDRELRNIYSKLPICTCEQGIFWPIREEELVDFRSYLKAKAFPMLKRWRRVAQAHPRLITDEYSQLDLF